MKKLENKYNIILIDEDFIGRVDNLKNYFIESLANYLLQNKEIEDNISCINITQEILEKLDNCNEIDIIRLCYNHMGTYYVSENGLER